MPMQVVVDGQVVVVDKRMWSFDNTVSPWAPNAYIGADLCDPRKVWKTQRSVRMVVGFIARNVAQVALHAFQRDETGDRSRLPPNRTLSKLLAQPSQVDTAYEYMYNLVVDICLWDRYCSVLRGDGSNLELVRLPPERWYFKRNGLNQPTKVIYVNDDRRPTEIELEECLWFDGYPVPDATPLDSLMDLLAEERESGQYRRQMWQKNGRFPGWIERPLDSPNWTRTARQNFRGSFAGFSGGGGREGETPILEEGMQYHELTNGITPETAQQLESRKFSLSEVAAAFFLPPIFVGVLDNANYSNVTAFREILYSDTLGPWFQQIQQGYNLRVLPHPRVFGTTGVFAEFNVGEKLRLAFDQQAQIFRTATGAPFMLRNEARTRLNLPRLADADELIVPKNVGFGDDGEAPDGSPDTVQE